MEENNGIIELSDQELEAASGGKHTKVMATKAGVNIRSGPGKNFAVIARTTEKAVATYTGEMVFVEGRKWIRVAWNGKSGWICADYVKAL